MNMQISIALSLNVFFHHYFTNYQKTLFTDSLYLLISVYRLWNGKKKIKKKTSSKKKKYRAFGSTIQLSFL